jgi:hypothetical protein
LQADLNISDLMYSPAYTSGGAGLGAYFQTSTELIATCYPSTTTVIPPTSAQNANFTSGNHNYICYYIKGPLSTNFNIHSSYLSIPVIGYVGSGGTSGSIPTSINGRYISGIYISYNTGSLATPTFSTWLTANVDGTKRQNGVTIGCAANSTVVTAANAIGTTNAYIKIQMPLNNFGSGKDFIVLIEFNPNPTSAYGPILLNDISISDYDK